MKIDLSTLPEHLRSEVYDFYLFVKQRYANASILIEANQPRQDKALKNLFETTDKQKIHVDSDVDIRELIEQTHDVEL